MVADLSWRIVGAGDMNGDGHTDLVWQHDTNGSIAAWLMSGSSMRSAILLSPGQVPDTNWKIRGVTDFNADRQPDLIWQNQVTGHLSVWFMRGTELAEGVRFTPESLADTNWQIVGPR